MKLRYAACFLLAAALLAGLQRPGESEKQLEAAIHKEVVQGDLKGAIDQYDKILAQKATPRPVAARALFQLGQCQEKLGQAEARKAYERLVKDYGDQAEIVAQARVRLAALGGGGGAGGLVARRVLADATGVDGVLTADGKYIRSLLSGR